MLATPNGALGAFELHCGPLHQHPIFKGEAP